MGADGHAHEENVGDRHRAKVLEPRMPATEKQHVDNPKLREQPRSEDAETQKRRPPGKGTGLITSA